jgi:thioredoxin-dependent peroxiredoxin
MEVFMGERRKAATFQGNPLTLIGPRLIPGDKAPAFSVLDAELKPVCLGDYKGKVLLIASVPSLDTPVCNLETIRFNSEAAKLPMEKVALLTVSMDLPFAQARFCSTEGVKNLKVASDHKDAVFGTNYGVLIKQLRLLSRAIFVVDTKGRITYVQYVKEITEHPDYDAALKAVKSLI